MGNIQQKDIEANIIREGREKCYRVLAGESGMCETKYLTHPVFGFRIFKAPIITPASFLRTPKLGNFFGIVVIDPTSGGKIIRPNCGETSKVGTVELRTNELTSVKVDYVNLSGEIRNTDKLLFSLFDPTFGYKIGEKSNTKLDESMTPCSNGLHFYVDPRHVEIFK